MASNNTISSSKKEIYSKFLDIAEKYMDVENTDFLTTGEFGYINECLALIARDSAINKSMIYNESFLNTAIMPQSVYNWAKMFNIQVTNATPAYAEIDIIIPRENLVNAMKSSKDYDGTRYGEDITKIDSSKPILIIDKENPIIAGEYYFALEHSILIIQESDLNFKANYISSEYVSTEYQTINSTILPVSSSELTITIQARAYQYRLNKIERQITTTSFLNKVQTFDFSDQFASAKLFYVPYNSSVKYPVDLIYSSIEGNATNSERYAYYNLNDQNKLELIFKSGDNAFIPSPNSKLVLYLYTTKGANVARTYQGDAIIKFAEESLQTLSLIVNFNPTTIKGGKNAPSISEIKKTIINEISTRNTIVTESDLNNYFQILTGLLNSVNDGKVKFIKKRDDILKRVFNAYVLMRDGLQDGDNSDASSTSKNYVSRCVPTNTVDVNFPIFKDNLLNTAFPKIRIEADNTYVASTVTPSGDYFVCPFYLHTILSPIKKVKYIYNLTDETTVLSYGTKYSSDNNDSDENYYIIPSTMRVYRGMSSSATPENKYTFIFNFKTNFKFDENRSNSNRLTLRLKSVDSNYERAAITLSEYDVESIESESEPGVYSSSISLSIPVSSQEFIIEENNNNYGSNIYLTESSIAFPEEIKLGLSLDNFQVSNTTFNADFVTTDKVRLFRNLDDIMLSDIELGYSTGTDPETGAEVKYISNIKIKDVPVVLASYFEDNDKSDKFEEQLFTYIDMLKENINKLESATFFDLKFFNTYGPSNFYSTYRTNIKLGLHITLRTSLISDVENVKTQIRSYVRRLVDKYNENEEIRVSDILSAITNSGSEMSKYISHVEFTGLNDTFNQYVYKLEDTTGIKDTIYPPEWFNIQPDDMETFIKFDDEA